MPEVIVSVDASGKRSRRSSNIKASDFSTHLKSCLLFYCEESEELAIKIAQQSPNITLGKINWKKFSDGFPNLFVNDAIEIRNRHVGFLASFHNPSVIFEQISVIYALPRLFIDSLTLILPFFPTGTYERIESEGEIATAFTLARILSNIPLSRGGPTSLVTYDIHALQERFYFSDSILPLFGSGIPLLLEKLKNLEDGNDISIAYPDDGAWKRFNGMFSDYPEIICNKIRDGDKRIVTLKEGSAEGRHVVIIDDLVRSGETILRCKDVLIKHGAKHVSAYVTHGIFPQDSWKFFKPEINGSGKIGFKYFWLTDSCTETVKAVKNQKPFEILSLAGPIAEALQI